MRRVLGGPSQARLYDVTLVAPATSSEPAQFGTWPGNQAAAAPVTAVHTEMGVRVTAPPRTESSIPVLMATNPVTPRVQRHEPAAGSDATRRA
eukprot:5867111-Pleurochrysis_carterae.AAC.1